MKRRLKGSVFLLIICVQFFLFGFSIGNANSFNNNEQGVPDVESLPNHNPSHYSPFYFPVNSSDPLFTEEDIESDSEDSPKLANIQSDNNNVLTVNLDKYVITSGEILTINLKLTNNFTILSGRTISIEIYQGYYRNYYSYYPNYYSTTTPIYIKNLTTNTNGEALMLFSMTSSEGLYTIYAFAEGYQSYKEFTVGEVGIFYKGPRYYKANQKYTAAIHVVNLTNFTGIPFSEYNYSISYYDYSFSNWQILISSEGQTDNFGYSIFNTNIPLVVDVYNSLKLTISTLDGKVEYQTFLYESWDYYYYSIWGGEQKTSQEHLQYVVTTDKTIYSPGENIHLRVLVLEYSFMNETKRILRNSPIDLTIYNPSELAIFWTTLTTDDYGVVSFNFPLDKDCELGFYGFEFSHLNDDYRYDVKVDYYEKPAFRVEIDTNGKDFFPINEKLFEGFIFVSYYFGQPVVGAAVELSILNYRGENQYTKEGFTNGEGRFYFSIRLSSIEDLEFTFNVQADVVDIYGRRSSSKKVYTRIEELIAYGYLTDWAPTPFDNLEYYFYVYQYVMSGDIYDYGYWNWNYNPLSNISVDIDIYGIRDYKIYPLLDQNKILLATYTKFTNIFGAGKLEFILPLDKIKPYNFFEIKLTVNLKDKRSTISSYYFRYKKYSLEIDILNPKINLGQSLDFNVTFKEVLTNSSHTGEGRIYIYDSQHQLIGQFSGTISGRKTLSFSIPSFYPEGNYYIYSYVYSRSNQYYYGFSYHSAHESFLVGRSHLLSFDTNFNNTGSYNDEITVQIGDIIEINGFSNVTATIPHYFEIYKRGLLYSIPLSINENNFSHILTVIADFAPKFSIIVYTISDLGKLYESILSVNVEYSYSIELSTDKDIYEPGDSLTLTISPLENISTMIALSFIDSAVLDVEPQDDSELTYFEFNPFSTYISSGSSWGSGFDATSYWWYGYGVRTGGIYYLDFFTPMAYAYSDYYLFDVEDIGQGGRSLPSFDELLNSFNTEIRENISESTNWIPELMISEPTNFSFNLPDNIGEWTIRVVANSISEDFTNTVLWGDIITKQIKTFLPFFIEFEVPLPVFQDDILTIKGYIYNYIGEDIHATIAIHAPNLIILNKDVQELFIPNNFVSEVEFSVYCTEAYNQNITLLATTEASGIKYSDAKQLTTYIKPNGIEIINRTIGFLNASYGSLALNYTLDPLAIYHKETLALYTDLMDISIDSWQSLVGYPYGCIEQTISKVLPTALIFNYLKQIGRLTADIEWKMTSMLLEGLSRIYNFQHSDGGWGWWRDDSSKVIMTSIVVSALNQIEEAGFEINSNRIKKGIDYLLSYQYSDGEWDFQDYSSNTLEATAYILKALMKFQNKTSQMNLSISKAVIRYKTLWYTGDMQSSYAASLYYIATVNSLYENTTFNSELIQFIKNDRKVEDSTFFWESDQNNPWYWRKLGNIVEITSYATWALALDDYITNYAIIQKSVRYLLNQRNRWGWGSTADTSAAINALTEIKGIMLSGGIIDFNGTISIIINNNEYPQYVLNFTEYETQPNEILLNLRDLMNENNNLINISLNGTGQISYIFENIQVIRSNPLVEIPDILEVPPNEKFNLTVKFSKIDYRMPLMDVSVSLGNIPTNLQDPEANYSILIPSITNGSQLLFSLKAPSTNGEYIIDGVSVLGFLMYTLENSSKYQLFQQKVGPIIIKVGNYPKLSHNLEELLNTTTKEISQPITLDKLISKKSFLISGETITITINITNYEDIRQFYVIEDEIPTGTIFVEDSVNFSGDYEFTEITYDLFLSKVHFFFPLLVKGNTKITYQLQIVNLKNSYSGICKLWGMYDEFSISAQSDILENIPRKLNPNQSIYLDLKPPIILNMSVDQNQESSEKKILIKLSVIDDNGINRIRVVFSQDSGWRAHTIYSYQNQENFSLILTDIKNINSEVKIFLEVFDIYGNIITTDLIIVKILAYELIPYLVIGMIITFSIGLASITSIYYRKFEERKHNLKYGLIDKKKQETRRISFIDESEEEMDKT